MAARVQLGGWLEWTLLVLLLGLMVTLYQQTRIAPTPMPQMAPITEGSGLLVYERKRQPQQPAEIVPPIEDPIQHEAPRKRPEPIAPEATPPKPAAPPAPEPEHPPEPRAKAEPQPTRLLPEWVDTAALYRATHRALGLPSEALLKATIEKERGAFGYRLGLYGGQVSGQARQQEAQATWQAEAVDAGQLFSALGAGWVSGRLSGEGVIDQRSPTRISGRVLIEAGYLPDLDFALLYCRAAAFTEGRAMPPTPARIRQPFEQLKGEWIMQPEGWRLESFTLLSDRFKLEGTLSGSGDRVRGRLTLSQRKPFIHPCGIDERWQAVQLPMTCTSRGSGGLRCSLDLRQLDESLRTHLGGTPPAPPAQRIRPGYRPAQQPGSFADPQRFRDRTIEESTIEEHDLRPLLQR